MQNSGQLVVLAGFILFAVWVFSRGRRQQRETQTTQSRVRPGVEVMMTSGLYGTVVEVEDGGTLRVETSPGVISRWDRRAVARILSAPGEPESSVETRASEEPEADAVAPRAEPPVGAPEPAAPTMPPVEPGELARPSRDVAPPDRS